MSSCSYQSIYDGGLPTDRIRCLDICPKLEPGDQLTVSVILPISYKPPPYESQGYGIRPAFGHLIKRMELTAVKPPFGA
jgi:hypothetical protein